MRKSSSMHRCDKGQGSMPWRLVGVIVLSLSAGGCGGLEVIPRASAPQAPTQGLTKCSVAASRSNPLVTEWPASEKANLEVRLREGAVAVQYSGCDMKLIPSCRLEGQYQWLRTTVASDSFQITNEDELYAKLPIGAVSLEGELRSSGRLKMQTTVTGQVRLVGFDATRLAASDECQAATHVLNSLSIGAFKLKSGGTLAAGASIDAPMVGAGAATKSSETILREAGAVDSCAESTAQSPHPDCRSPIQMFLAPLPWTRDAEVPAGMTRAKLLGSRGVNWEVSANGQPLCTTPCDRDLDPTTSLQFASPDKGFFAPKDSIDVPPLRDVTSANNIVVRGEPTSFGLFALGLSATSLGGMAVLAGIPLTIVGGVKENGLLTAGIVSGGVGLAVLIPGIMAITAALPHPEIEELGLVVTPEGVGWRF
jgi:hypothetical protein